MTRALRTAAVVILAVAGLVIGGPSSGPAHAAGGGSDEFAGPAGARPDRSIWTHDVGGGGWGNDERQVYTSSTANSRLDGEGHLVIEARKEQGGITSARLTTQGKFSFTYGTLSARIKMPRGGGLHPAFWLLGDDIGTVGYPASGEIDVVEFINEGSSWHTALHGPTVTATHWQQTRAGAFPGGNPGDGFHTYSVFRAPGLISMSIDGRMVSVFTAATLAAGELWVFDKPMYVLLDLAVGGRWPGPVSRSTEFPARMLVDWVRYTP
ncbi:glycoside hydrolase family 16 protein [Gordonia sp. NPDC003424]